MELVTRPEELAARLEAVSGRPVHLVPTMGNLHAGHLALIERARTGRALVVASIFVNPTQFGPGEDFADYPRTLEADCARLEALGCDLAWAPSVAAMYPLGLERAFGVRVPAGLAGCLCGASRPGHFDGVAGAVLRLFNQVRPQAAFFGEKDFQQLLIIRRLVRDFALPVDVVAVPTVREADGLAYSSRNQYLDAAERAIAPRLHEVLVELAARAAAGGETFRALERSGRARLEEAGFRPDYVEFRDEADLGPPEDPGRVRVFAAAWLGRARLIDNLPVEIGGAA